MKTGVRKIKGVTLIELMVALTIGSFLMIGAVTVFMQSRTAFRLNESVSRLQETARFVVDTLEPDIRMASYFGLTSRPTKIANSATPSAPVPPGLIVNSDCGQNWAINMRAQVSGTNNAYSWNCPAFGNGAVPLSDTLEIRRVLEDPVTVLQDGTMYLQSARFWDSQLFVGEDAPAGPSAGSSTTHGVVVNGYYVSQSSSLDRPGNPVPSLRVKTLIGGPGVGPTIVDQEITPGVEDLQVEFGVDIDDIDDPGRGSIDRYVNPGDPIITPGSPAYIPNAQIIAVRLWLRVRAERPENGFRDDVDYNYSDRAVPAFNDQFRRTVVTKTIYLRNVRGPV